MCGLVLLCLFVAYCMIGLQIGDGTSEHSHTGRWATLQTAKGTYGPEDCINDLVEIKFDRPVPIKVSIFTVSFF